MTSRFLSAVLAALLAGSLFASPPLNLTGHFVGMLPCADCTGIQLDLTLRNPVFYGGPAFYQLKQTYQGTRDGSRTYSEKGTWTIVRGSAKDPRAMVYELTSDSSHTKQFYLRVNKNTLHLLDNHKQELPPNLPQTLSRVPPLR